jgi:hypothetical protein
MALDKILANSIDNTITVNAASFTVGSSFIANSSALTTVSNTATIGTTLYVVANGSVGVGTATPGAGIKLDVLGGEIKAGRIDFDSEGGQVSFGRASDNLTAWYIDAYGNTSSPSLRFVDVGTGAVSMGINSSGAVALRGAVSASGVGVTFPATQSASTDANTLDDYEEGTWTPSLVDSNGGAANTSKYSLRQGTYIKVGGLVWARFAIQLDGTSGAVGTLGAFGAQVSGLPFTSGAGLVTSTIYLYSGFGAGFEKGMATAYLSGTIFTEIYNNGNNFLGTSATNSLYFWGSIVYSV